MVKNLQHRLRGLQDDEGFTLVELLIATAMMVVICGAAVMMLISVMKQTPKISSRADQIGFARNAIEDIAAEVRQGKEATSTGPSQMTLKTFCSSGSGAASECTVSYSCVAESGKSTFACNRTVAGKTTPAVTGLASAEVFCFYPNTESKECGKASTTSLARYVGIQVKFPKQIAAGTETVLEGGAALHNSSSLLAR